MPQETNLNVSPYFDDFDPQKNYYKVLFKPGYPVQARELTGLQSIFQNQIEQFGNHVFKEGSVVIPGGINYIGAFSGVSIQNTFNNINVDSYIDNLLNKIIIGQDSGVKAKVAYILKQNDSNNPNTVLYLNYLNTSDSGEETFIESENLLVEEEVTPGFTEITSIQANQAFASTLNSNHLVSGSAVFLSEGVYYLRGTFVNVNSQTLILDYNFNYPSYKIGLRIFEDVINSDIDESLVDNAKGFSNYAAPGADRFRITAVLDKLVLTDDNVENFVEILRVEGGTTTRKNSNPQYNYLSDEFARRTYDESGDYYVKPLKIEVKNSLNNGKGNDGIFFENQATTQNNVPSDDLGCYRISPGKAYVKGYETELLSSTIVDFEKPRSTKTLNNQSIIYSTGSTYSLNRVYGSPSLGISSSYTVSLRNSRVGENQYSASGKEIGVARVYDFALESGSYDSTLPQTNQWEISLYDIQTYTEISLNEPITLSTPIFIKGKATGATGFLRYDVNNSGILTAYNTKGTFAKGEKFVFDGIENNRVAIAITSYGTGDVKSLYGVVGSASTFTADTKQYPSINVGLVNITASSGGISTVRSSDFTFVDVATAGNLVSFSNAGLTTSVFARIVSVSEKSITISGVTTVTGICEGALPTTSINPSDFIILKSRFLNTTDNTLYTPLGKKYISSVDLSNSQITIRKQFDVTISSNSLTVSPTQILSNETFLPFDEERYVLIRNDGSTEPLSSDQFVFTSGGKQLTINGLQSNGNAKLIATLQKTNIKARVKNKNRVNSTLVNKSIYMYSGTNSGIGNTTNNDGLVFGNYPYGTRVQDEDICLNVPEVTKIYAIFESSGIQDPSSPVLILQNISSTSSTTSEVIIGEEIIGTVSGNIAICLEKPTSLSVGYVSLNGLSFIEGESIIFKESNVTSVVNTIVSGSNDIKNNFTLNNGQKSTILDYSRIVRKVNTSSPTKKLKIYFESAYIPSSDTGDITVFNSYEQFDYCDLQSVDNNRISDIIDARPIVDQFNPNLATRSPFEFFGRSFDANQNSSLDILASDESLICNYSFYLGRIDRIYLSSQSNTSSASDSTFRIPVLLAKQGVPSESPQLPDEISDALEIARVALPPYLCNIRDASISLVDHKRYRMQDISNLETRIKSLEFYTSLSLLENNSKNLQIKDSRGLDRFKSGIFVDDFTTRSFQSENGEIKNSIDPDNSELRPSPYTTEIDLLIGSRSIIGVGTQINPNADVKYVPDSDIIGTNFKRSGINPSSTGKGVVTLSYVEVPELVQPFATRIENVTPYLVASYIGTIELNPSSDVWVDPVKIEPLTIEGIEGRTTVTQLQLEENNFDPQSGWNPVFWNAWQNNWTGSTSSSVTRGFVETITSTQTGTASRTGTTSRTLNSTNRVSLGNRVVSIDVSPYMRSRNIEFNAKRLRPFSRVYAFFDGQDVNRYVIPKLIEIEMLEGVFSVGEDIVGLDPNNLVRIGGSSGSSIRVRCASPNHRYGPFNSPSDIFTNNPYNQTQQIQSSYTSNSSVLNIDTVSLSEFASGNYSGFISIGMILTGQNSKARARISNIRLFTDGTGVVIGSFFVPDPNVPTNPSFKTGTKTLKLTSDPVNSPLIGQLTSRAETNFLSDGIVTQNQETTLAIRNTEIQNATISASRSITQTTTQTIDRTPPPPPQPPQPSGGPAVFSAAWWASLTEGRQNGPIAGPPFVDPLAQTFTVGSDSDNIGRYITSIDLYFQSKDSTVPVEIQLRSVSLGTPTSEIYPFSRVVVYPNQINVSNDASVPTRINFSAPVYLSGNREHAVVILSDSNEYNVWISRLGEVDISTASGPESGTKFVTSQNLLGSLFKSQNASTWTPSQYEDLKFNLYSARFDFEGSITFFNPELNQNNKQIATLRKDALQINSRRVRVGLGTTIKDSNLVVGNQISQLNSNATGTYVGAGGSVTGNLQIINAGIGYTPSSGSLTYNNVSLTSVTGNGRDAKANITIQNGVAIAATVSLGGAGYSIGDILTVSSIGINSLGRNLRLSAVGIAGTNELIIDNVQGDFIVGVGNTLQYSSFTGAGVTSINGGGVNITSTPIVESDGLHIKVNHRNHGMHYPTNTVVISNVLPDTDPSRIVAEYSSTSTDNLTISAGFTTVFSTFENIGIGTTNLGYAIIDNEIISYSGIVGNTLTGITRGIDSTIVVTHPTNSLIYKYELGGVSLRRINTTHQLQDATVNNSLGLDYYNIKIGMSTNGVDRTLGTSTPKLYLNSTKSTGGSSINATQNIPFEIIRPIVQTVVHPETRLSAEIRTTSGTSISGSEISFENEGFTPLSIDEDNYFSTPRIVASKVNETSRLTNVTANKSMEVRFNLRTSDSRLTPVIDLDRVGMILVSNRVNNVITDYVTDSRVSTIKDDPSAFIYATKNIQLEIPATSIRVIVSAYINPYADLRALYSITTNPSEDPIYYPFPGYSNRIESGQVIDVANNDGTSDTFVPKNNTLGFDSNEITFKDYEFTVDNLESFRYFSIKLVGTSTNQSYPPRLRDLRVIAVA
jgi:hypothetical protein